MRTIEIFNMREGIDYEFTMPSIAIGGAGLTEELVNGRWRLTQQIDPDGPRWTAEHESRTCAVLLLIAARMGFVGDLRYMTDLDEDDGAGPVPDTKEDPGHA